MNSSNRKGFILPTVIFAVTIMSVVAVVALSTATDERRTSRASRESTLAMYAAEAGLRQTYGAWPAGVSALNPGDSLDLGWKTLPNRAAYRAVIHRVDKGGLQEYAVVVGTHRSHSRHYDNQGAVGVPADARSLPTLDCIEQRRSADDSDRGAYVAAGADSTANLRSGVDLYVAQTLVKGEGSAVTTVTLGASGVVTGGTTAGIAPVPVRDILPCPGGGFTPTANVPTGPGISYNAVSGVLYLNGGLTNLTLTDTAYFFSSIVLTNNAKLTLPGNPRVNIVLRDSLNAAGGNIINQSNYPPAVSFSSCGTSATPAYWALSSGSGPSAAPGYFSVYAPNHVVYELGGGDFYGAVVAWIYFATGGGRFHYDAALARQPAKRLEVQRGSGAQLPGS
jgi:type II secretory pathway pseudopilin PulG